MAVPDLRSGDVMTGSYCTYSSLRPETSTDQPNRRHAPAGGTCSETHLRHAVGGSSIGSSLRRNTQDLIKVIALLEETMGSMRPLVVRRMMCDNCPHNVDYCCKKNRLQCTAVGIGS